MALGIFITFGIIFNYSMTVIVGPGFVEDINYESIYTNEQISELNDG